MGLLFLPLILIFLNYILYSTNVAGYWPPSPGYWPSTKLRSMSFYEGYRNLWGPNHQRVDTNALTIWLDSSSGSGFKSVKPFRSGYFGASIMLQPVYTAGVIKAFYLSNNEVHPGYHDEVDIEFLGTTFGKPYTLQTNVYIQGCGDGNIIGREMKYHPWFDPTAHFHHYAVLWSPKELIFLVDDIPIWRYPRKSASTFPLRPMWIYGSIWDASSWATEDGKYKVDYQYQPFVGRFTNFKARVAPPIPQGDADLFPFHHSGPVALVAGSTRPCIGYKLTTWSITIVGTVKEITLKHLSAGVRLA